MTQQPRKEAQDRDIVLYMDVLGHDILNNNQAVQGYLELILASPSAGDRERAYAEKAVSHIRTSTFLLENIRKIAAASKEAELGAVRPVDLARIVEQTKGELARLFPQRRVTVTTALMAPKPVASESVLQAVVMNLMVDMVRLDENRDVSMRLGSEGFEDGGKRWCQITVENPGALVPAFLKGEVTAALASPDKSKTVKVTGILFAAIISRRLGGKFELQELGGEQARPGCKVTVTLMEGAT